MIILITGASHTGKTVLAQRMLEKYKYPYLSIDHLKMGLIRSGNTDLTPEDDDDLTQYLWPIVREMIKTAIENKQNLIVEGCYVPFYWRQDFDEQYIRSIQFIGLAMSDEYIDTHFDEIKEHGSEIEARLDDSFCTIEEVKRDNRKIIDGYHKSGEKVEIIQEDFEFLRGVIGFAVFKLKTGRARAGEKKLHIHHNQCLFAFCFASASISRRMRFMVMNSRSKAV